jgi:DNA replication protein DnaC
VSERLSSDPDYKIVTLSRIKRANIGRRYWKTRLKDIPDDASHKKKLLTYTENMPDMVHSGMGLILRGTPGTGKTAAACRLLMEAMARGPIKSYFVLAQNIDHHAMNRGESVDDGTSIWKLITSDADVCVIDDLAAERKTEWTSRWVELVLTERYHRQLPTIVTTNMLTTDDGYDLFSRYPRLEQLAMDAYQVVDFDDLNWRG